ncbi:hypothetical protein AQI88_13670 [Streptomyces cellostaticus]|uniref:Uncharacterized protein n=1 Tax=Streptomyces cellostaticus TaxID=67285 RepID=A0A101NMP1_9ACTN|nr:hypothetical protein AQI88_13670 [Streptomyces cellostaticus]
MVRWCGAQDAAGVCGETACRDIGGRSDGHPCAELRCRSRRCGVLRVCCEQPPSRRVSAPLRTGFEEGTVPDTALAFA